jgi:iron complex outermembrane receptor protein
MAALGCAAAAGVCQSPARAQSNPPSIPPVVVQQQKPAVAKAGGQTVKASQKAAKPKAGTAPATPAATPEPEVAEQPVTRPSLAAAPANTSIVGSEAIAARLPASSDTASLLGSAPGVSLYQAGGVSSLPVIHGMEDHRVRTEINGMMLESACANHMNPALSYIEPVAVGQAKVVAGVTPVSEGGDSIGGTIKVKSPDPRFAAPGQDVLTYGSVSAFGRSNGNGRAASGTVSAATENANLTYAGGWSQSDDYQDGNGREVKSTLYEAGDHQLSLTLRGATDAFQIQGGYQDIPVQGFVNQRMDMDDNEAWFINSRYSNAFDWGKLDLQANYQDVRHEMDFLADGNKAKYYMGGFRMPMYTHGQNFGYSVQAEIPLSLQDTLRVGNELHGMQLDDWWPPVFESRGMQPLTFWNINNGERYDVGTFVEWEAKWSQQWTTLLGARNDTVTMDAGAVQGYKAAPNLTYAPDAAAFNARDRARTDVNFDATALARFEPDALSTFEAGYAMKTRSPSLYERYAWSTSMMGSEMNGWFGDGNSYVGNLDLKPETAHTVSFTAGWHDSTRKEWSLGFTPYYTYVQDYIDVDRCSIKGAANARCRPGTAAYTANQAATSGYVELMFANHDAELYGLDVSGRMPLFEGAVGKFGLGGVAGLVHGENLDTGDSLYHMMPFNAKLALEHSLGNWSSAIELKAVSDKDTVQSARNELVTPGYALVNLRTSYQLEAVRFDLGVDNLFDRQYFEPLGGAYLGDGKVGAAGPTPVAGAGRAIYGGVTVKF